jgi:hypothetical protein
MNPSNTKLIQAEPSKIAWICLVLFVPIGTFQWVTAKKIKKSCLLPRRVGRPAGRTGLDPAI